MQSCSTGVDAQNFITLTYANGTMDRIRNDWNCVIRLSNRPTRDDQFSNIINK